MDRIPVKRLAIVVALLVASGFSPAVRAQQQEFAARSGAPVTFLQINDVYSTVPVNDLGGLARVATLKQSLAKAGRISSESNSGCIC